MTMQTRRVPPPRPALQRVLTAWRSPGWMRARKIFNAYRIVLGVLLLASVHWTGALALLGIIPIAWAAVSYSWIYRVEHGDTVRN